MTAESLVKTLNNALERDQQAVAALFAIHVPCHPDFGLNICPITCRAADYGGYELGIIGLLNGAMPEGQAIAGCYSDAGELLEFRVITPTFTSEDEEAS